MSAGGFTHRGSQVRNLSRLPGNNAISADVDGGLTRPDRAEPEPASAIRKHNFNTVDPDGLYLRGNVWWARIKGERLSTGCRDREAAIVRRAKMERARAHRVRVEEFVYFARDGQGRIKIGFSRDPSTRRQFIGYQVGGEVETLLVIQGDRRTERCLHAGFTKLALGGEWFEPAPDLLAFIESLRASADPEARRSA